MITNQKKEDAVFYVLLLVLTMLNLLTIKWYPKVWVDEVSYSDPSVSFVLGKGFTSTTWASQNMNEFWASNAPLHQYLLIPWLKLLGISIATVRSINLVFMVISSLLLWNLFKTSSIIKDLSLKLLFVSLFWLSEMMSFIYRDGRPDCLAILLAIGTMVIFFSDSPKRKFMVLGIGFLSVLAGIQLPPFICIVLGITFLFSHEKKKIFWFGVQYGAGIVLGLVSLLLFLQLQGSAYAFLTQTFASGYTVSGDLVQSVVYSDSKITSRVSGRIQQLLDVKGLYFRDSSTIVLGILLTVLAVRNFIMDKKNTLLIKILLCYVLVPPFILILGRYPDYYSWMGILVLLLGTIYGLQNLGHNWLQMICIAALMITCLFGLPASLYNQSSGTKRQEEILKLVLENTDSSDWVYGDHEAYYACKLNTGEFFSLSYSGGRGLPLFPEDQKNKITKLIIYPSQLSGALKKIGGEWKEKAATENSLTVYQRK